MQEAGRIRRLHTQCCIATAASAGSGAVAYVALTGDVGTAIAAMKDAAPLLVFPAKAAVAFPLVG
jgi:hypothetical protein